ncbi:MAG: acyltransferase [Planctomycetota bacterium]|jgi:phenylacetic acid degradation protein
MPYYEFEGIRPVVDPTAYVHPDAVLIGDVIIGPRCFVGPGASLRGDIGRLTVKAGANVQDNCVLHTFPGRDVLVEEDGHIGHGAVLHGCTVRRGALIGIRAVVMDDAEIGEESLVAAMAFVKAKTIVPPRTLVAGVPAKVVRSLEPDEVDWKSRGTEIYQHLAERYRATARAVEPLPEVEAERRRLPELAYELKPERDRKCR